MNTQTQIKVLEAAKIVCMDNYNHIGNRLGLCYAIKIALRKYCPDQMIAGMGPWWPKKDFLSRLGFFNRIIKQLKAIQNV